MSFRLVVVLVHPVQYYAPWFRHLASACPEIELAVLYATEATPEQQGVGFGRAFTWDVPLAEGYAHRVLTPARAGQDLSSDAFRGVDVPEIGAEIERLRPDAVLVPGWYSITLVRAIRACRRAGLPLIYRGDSTLDTAPQGLRRLVWAAKTRFLLAEYDAWLATGQRSREYLEAMGAGPERIFSSPHAVDNAHFASTAAPFQTAEARAAVRRDFGLPEDGFIALFAGKLTPIKRPLDLIRAVSRLGPEASLLVVGEGPLREECRAEAERLGVRMAWAGFLNQSEIGRAYAAADCLVLPSASETWGLAVNEALATGLPAVVSDRVGCAPDLVTPGVTGEVFPAGDGAALAAALERLQARGAGAYAAACRERAAAFSFAAATAGLVQACQAIAPRAFAPPAVRPPRVVACCGAMVVIFGLERMTFEVLRALGERGAALHCIVNDWESHRILERVEEVGASWSYGRYWETLDRHTRNPWRLARMLWDILATSAGLLRDAWSFDATHVLVPDFLTVLRNGPALLLLRATGVEVIFMVGVAPVPDRFYRRVWRYGVAPLVSRLVANSEFTRREILAHGIPPRKVARIYNTIPTRTRAEGVGETAPARDPGKVIYVGQVIPEKGVDALLEAVAGLASVGVDVRLDVVGPIDGWEPPSFAGYRAGLVERSAAPDLAGRVRFLGWREDIPELLAQASVHCCPSLPECREAFGLVVLEAKEAGLPTVTYQSGALPELVRHGVDGWICDTATPEALGEGLYLFLDDRERLTAAAAAASASLAPFSRRRFARRWWTEFTAPPARILACCGGFSIVSGLERMTFEVLRTLAERGARVHCIVNSWDHGRIVELAQDIGASWSVGRYAEGLARHAASPAKIGRMAWDILLTSAGLLRDAWRFRPKAILVPEFMSVLRNAPALLLLKALGVPVILRVGNAPEPDPFYERLWRWAIAPLVTLAVANSSFGARRLAEAGFPAGKIERVHNTLSRRRRTPDWNGGVGADAEAVQWMRRRPTLVCLGQIAHFKGTHLAVGAFLSLLSQGYDIQGAIVGRLPDWPAEYLEYARDLIERVRAAGQADRIRFLGEREDVPALLGESFLLAAPILQSETFGNVVLEALAAGVPAVVFPTGGLPELVEHGTTGWICETSTPEALLAGLRAFLDDPERRERAGRAARERFAEFEGPYGRRTFARDWSRVFGVRDDVGEGEEA